MGYLSPASEFPNDNTEISRGGIWVCAELTGPPELEHPGYEPVPVEPFVLFFADHDGYVDGPVELEITGGELSVAVHEAATHMAAQPRTDAAPAYAHFESALLRALMAQGSSRAAALLPRILRLESLPAEALSKEVKLTLQSRGYLDGNGRYSQKYRDLCAAWSAVLRGETQDFAACGTTTLDRFGADLLAALLAVPATRADELRRELRKSGIAAFGVLAAA